MFKRIIDFHLDLWRVDPFRKPLLLRGARQVGKTYAVRRLGGAVLIPLSNLILKSMRERLR